MRVGRLDPCLGIRHGPRLDDGCRLDVHRLQVGGAADTVDKHEYDQLVAELSVRAFPWIDRLPAQLTEQQSQAPPLGQERACCARPCASFLNQ